MASIECTSGEIVEAIKSYMGFPDPTGAPSAHQIRIKQHLWMAYYLLGSLHAPHLILSTL